MIALILAMQTVCSEAGYADMGWECQGGVSDRSTLFYTRPAPGRTPPDIFNVWVRYELAPPVAGVASERTLYRVDCSQGTVAEVQTHRFTHNNFEGEGTQHPSPAGSTYPAPDTILERVFNLSCDPSAR